MVTINRVFYRKAKQLFKRESGFRGQLEDWLGTLSIKAEKVLDIGGGELPVKGRVREWQVSDYRILDANIKTDYKPDFVLDLNNITNLNNKWISVRQKETPTLQKVLRYKPNIIFCLEVFEYLYNPLMTLQFMHKVLATRGVAYISLPSLYPVHDPIVLDYLRYTKRGIEVLASKAGFSKVEMVSRVAKNGRRELENFYKKERMHAVKNTIIYDIGYLVKAYK